MQKLKGLLSSRKFWATVTAIVAAVTAAINHAITWADAVNAIVAALAAYAIGTGLESPVPTGDK